MTSPQKNKIDVEKKLVALDEKKDLIRKVLVYIKSSRMSLDEKKMWLAMLPYMEQKYIAKLADILEREVNEYTEAYISSLNMAVSK